MEARRRVEFTGVDLAGGAKLATLGGEGRDKSSGEAAAGPRTLEGYGGREARGTVEREEDGLLRYGAVEMPAV
jgi:hypothetical protein